MSYLLNLQTKSRHHYPVGLLESFELEVNSGDEPELEQLRVAFIVWDKTNLESYAVIFYKGGQQAAVYEYSTKDRPLTWVEPQDDGPLAA
jgi:hypothetical protein